jgi:hypothetical protein
MYPFSHNTHTHTYIYIYIPLFYLWLTEKINSKSTLVFYNIILNKDLIFINLYHIYHYTKKMNLLFWHKRLLTVSHKVSEV